MRKIALLLGAALALSSAGCSFRRVAVNKLGDALSAGGSSYGTEEDPELARAAAPFGLKLMESLLAETPRHSGLLFATSSGFTQYAYAFVQQDADELEEKDFAAAQDMKTRARRLYLRARNYGLRGLEVKHPGFEKRLRADSKEAVQGLKAPDVPLLYWTGVAWAGAISLAKDDPQFIGELPLMEALMDRALELNESYGNGALHSFFITYEMSRQGLPGDPAARARKHFERAMALGEGFQAGPLLALAEAVAVQNQDLNQFESLLKRALAINVDARPEWRLANVVMQRRAKWLLGRTDQLFLRAAPTEQERSE